MDSGKLYGLCTICGKTMSVHINVSRPLDHKIGPPAKPGLGEIATGYINEVTEVGEEGVRERVKDAVQVMLAKKRTSFEDRGK